MLFMYCEVHIVLNANPYMKLFMTNRVYVYEIVRL